MTKSESEKARAEIVEFMTLFARLKDWCDDAPEQLSGLTRTDSSVKDLCTELSSRAHSLQRNERRQRVLFVVPVDPSYVVAWREYEERYESVVLTIWLDEIFLELGAGEPSQTPKADLQWNAANYQADEETDAIEAVFDFADFNADQADRWDTFQVEYIEQIQEGISAWLRLKEDADFDLRGAFRRRALVPFVHVPRQVAAKQGTAEKLSMLKNLQQAQEAFVYGASYAALALMRSIMEAVLRDHYGAEGEDLSERIRNARSRLPRGASAAALHRLRKLANAVLHLDREEHEGLARMDDERLEKEIVALLFVLRALIEGVK